MVRILENSLYEEELNILELFNLKKRRLTGDMIVILQKGSKLVLPIFQMAKLEVTDNLQQIFGSIIRRDFVLKTKKGKEARNGVVSFLLRLAFSRGHMAT